MAGGKALRVLSHGAVAFWSCKSDGVCGLLWFWVWKFLEDIPISFGKAQEAVA